MLWGGAGRIRKRHGGIQGMEEGLGHIQKKFLPLGGQVLRGNSSCPAQLSEPWGAAGLEVGGVDLPPEKHVPFRGVPSLS